MSIYIDALRFAEKEGLNLSVSYNKTVNFLFRKGHIIEGDFEEYFLLWFFDNFYEKYAYSTLENGNPNQVNDNVSHLRTFQFSTFPITSKGYSTLQEYYKLEQTKKDAIRANIIAILALVITIVVGLIQILLQMITANIIINKFKKIGIILKNQN